MAALSFSLRPSTESLPVLVAVLVLVAAAGCGKPTPTCDVAAGFDSLGQLGGAAESYALARERGEGDCADAGLSRVKDRYGDAYVDVAQGRVAEDGGDGAAAVTAYRAALTIDADNSAAKDGLNRLQQQGPPPRRAPQPAAVPPAVPQAPPALPWAIGLLIAAVGLLAILVGLIIWTVIGWRRWSARQDERQAGSLWDGRKLRDELTALGSEADGAAAPVLKALSKVEESGRKSAHLVVERLSTHDAALSNGLRRALEELQTVMAGTGDQVDLAFQDRISQLEETLDDVVDVMSDLVADGRPAIVAHYVRPAAVAAADDGR